MQIKDVFSTSHWMKRQQIFLIDYGLNVQKYLGPSIILLIFLVQQNLEETTCDKFE